MGDAVFRRLLIYTADPMVLRYSPENEEERVFRKLVHGRSSMRRPGIALQHLEVIAMMCTSV